MRFAKFSAAVALFAVSVSAQGTELPDVGASPQQTKMYIQDVKSYIKSLAQDPSFISFYRDIQPYVTNAAQVQAGVEQYQPTDVQQVSVFATAPLAFATDGPVPAFVKKMPPPIRSEWNSYISAQLKAGASLIRQDLGVDSGDNSGSSGGSGSSSGGSGSSSGGSGGSSGGSGGNSLAPQLIPGTGVMLLGAAAGAVGLAAVML